MPSYELMVVVKPQMAEEEKANLPVDIIKALVEKNEGEVTTSDDWGEKTLAYPIQGHERGYYVVSTLKIPAEQAQKLRTQLNLEKGVLRWLMMRHGE
jgi:small subunit ribosomal protein S6